MKVRLKSVVAIATLLALPFVANAKVVDMSKESGLRFGANASFTLNNLGAAFDFHDSRPKYDYKGTTFPSFKVDGIVDMAFTRSLHLKTGLTYALKGQRMKLEKEVGKVLTKERQKVKLGYLEVPVQASLRMFVGSSSHIQVDFGPYFAVAVHGTYKRQTNVDGKKGVQKIGLFSGNTRFSGELYEGAKDRDGDDDFKPQYKRFDFGLAMGVGYVINDIYMGITSDIGLIDIKKNDNSTNRTKKTRLLGFTVGYTF